jgi:hypothetical protein
MPKGLFLSMFCRLWKRRLTFLLRQDWVYIILLFCYASLSLAFSLRVQSFHVYLDHSQCIKQLAFRSFLILDWLNTVVLQGNLWPQYLGCTPRTRLSSWLLLQAFEQFRGPQDCFHSNITLEEIRPKTRFGFSVCGKVPTFSTSLLFPLRITSI